MTPDEVNALIDSKIAAANAFATNRYGDTPTDALQVVNRKYVDSKTNFFIDVGIISSGVASKTIPHGLGIVPTMYGISPTTDWYYSGNGKTYSIGITVDATNLYLNKTPDSTITTGYIVFAK